MGSNLIKEGDRVYTECVGIYRHGEVETIYSDLTVPIAIVKFDDGLISKVLLEDLYLDMSAFKPEPEPEPNQEEEIPEGAKKITKDEFIEAIMDVTSPEGMFGDKKSEVNPALVVTKGLAVMITGFKIANKVFKDSNEVYLTKEQLKDIIVKNTNPSKLVEDIDNTMSESDLFVIALISGLVLMKLVNVFFGDSEK